MQHLVETVVKSPEQGAKCSFIVKGKSILQVEKIELVGQGGMAQVFLVKTPDNQQLILRKVVSKFR